VWEDYRTVGGPAAWDGRDAAGVVARGGVGNPDYAVFADARIPPMFRGPSFPSGGLGSTELTPAGPKGDLRPRD
jgi:hypothetical protein